MNKYEYIVKSNEMVPVDVDKKGTVVFYPATFGVVDNQGDITQKGAFTKTLNENFGRVRYFFKHDFSRKLGEPLDAWEDDKGLVVKAALNLNKEDGKNTYEDYRMALEYGKTVEHSFGGFAIKTDGKPLDRPEPLKNPRTVYEWQLMEISYVPSWGANPNTPLISLKEEDIQFLSFCMKNGNYTDCAFKQMEALLDGAAVSTPTTEDAELKHYLKTILQIL